jgi:16S rRNA (cytosine967-C5)-methyltransferase
MRPEARLQAAIDVLGLWAEGTAPVDEVLAAWGRAHRFAGAKDRAAIAARVYAIFRQHASIVWRMGSASPRALLIGSLAEEGQTPEAIGALFSGARYAPPPLSDDERARLNAEPGPPATWVRGNYPEWLEPQLKEAFGQDFDAEIAALNGRAPLDLRVNTLKATRRQVLALLAEAGLSPEPCPISPVGVRLTHGARVAELALFREGLIEIQDEGSQIVSLLCGARPGMCVVDLAAGAGGKTLALAAAMGDEGRILACDVNAKRLHELSRRARRAGVDIVERRLVRDFDPKSGVDPSLADLAARADLVVLDAPCSGSGTWRRAPDLKWRLTLEQLLAHERAQERLLGRAARLVRPGGRLCYITCSVLRGENEAQIEALLGGDPHFRLIRLDILLQEAGLRLAPAAGAVGLRLSPARQGTDGFFIACLERSEGIDARSQTMVS